MKDNARPATSPGVLRRPVLFPLGRVGDTFTVGEAPIDLSAMPRPLELGRGGPEQGPRPGRIPVDDPWMSSRHARIVDGARPHPTGTGRLFIEDLGSKNGVIVNGAALQGKGRSRTPLLHGDIVETGRTFWVFVEDKSGLPVADTPIELGSMATWVPRLGEQLLLLQGRARSGDHVLVHGPEGAGKGFLARNLHQVSRREGRFLHMSCRERKARRAAVDLFGDGQRPGRLREGQGGTLLLEHLDALPLELQRQLATALRQRAFVPEGKTRPIPLEVRVVGTVTGSLADAVARGRLAPELHDALGELVVELPGLEQRLPDLGLLLDDFMTRAKGAPAISREACRVLFRHAFNQGVRGFARVIEAAASLAVETTDGALGGTIDLTHLPLAVAGAGGIRALLQQALPRPGGGDDHGMDAIEPTGEFRALSMTGEDPGAPPTGLSSVGLPPTAARSNPPDDASEASGFSAYHPTDVELPQRLAPDAPQAVPARPQRPDTGRRRGTASAFEAAAPEPPGAPERRPTDGDGDDVDPEALVAALTGAHGNVSAAARVLGKPRATVLRWVRELGIDPLAFR